MDKTKEEIKTDTLRRLPEYYAQQDKNKRDLMDVLNEIVCCDTKLDFLKVHDATIIFADMLLRHENLLYGLDTHKSGRKGEEQYDQPLMSLNFMAMALGQILGNASRIKGYGENVKGNFLFEFKRAFEDHYNKEEKNGKE